MKRIIQLFERRVMRFYALALCIVNFLTPLFGIIRYVAPHDFVEARGYNGYFMLGREYVNLTEGFRIWLSCYGYIHIVISVLTLAAMAVFNLLWKTELRGRVCFIAALISFSLSIVYAINGFAALSSAKKIVMNVYYLSTYAYIPVLIVMLLTLAACVAYRHMVEIDED